MKHPAEVDLALYSGGDLGLVARWRTAAHINRCPRCQREVAMFRGASEGLKQSAAGLPGELNWNRLAAEMKANIRLALDAGEIVSEPNRVMERFGWRAAFALGAITVVIVSGWWLHLPEPRDQAAESGIVLVSTGDGIELKEGGAALTLMHPSTDDVTFTVNTGGGVRARYVDAQNGQVTIHNVYAE